MKDPADDERLLLLLLLFNLLIPKWINLRKLQSYNSMILTIKNIKQMKLYSLLQYISV